MCVFKHKDKHTSARGGYENNIFFEKICAGLFSYCYNFLNTVFLYIFASKPTNR